MKVIKQGVMPLRTFQWPIGEKFTCKCGCEWVIETNNDYITVHSNGGPFGYRTIACTCPTCKKQNRYEDKREENGTQN